MARFANIRFAASLSAGVALLLAVANVSAQGPTRALQDVSFTAMPGDAVRIVLSLSEPAPDPRTFTVESPARLSLDLPDTRSAMAERYKKVNIGQITSVATAEARGRTRVVVEMHQLVPYTVSSRGSQIIVELAGRPNAAPARSSAASAAAPAPKPEITNIDFRRGETGQGRIIVTLTDPKTPVDVREEGGKIIAEFKNTALPDRFARRLDVLDFATPVKYIDAMQDGIHSRIVVSPISSGDFDQVAYQSGSVFTLELQPLTLAELEQRERDKPKYTGERISLSFQSVDIRALLQIIADVAGVNMVVSDSVSGDIALRLQNVPYDQALDIILRTKGLGMREEGNVILVAPVQELAERERVELEAQAQKEQLAPLRSEIVQINYAKASDIAGLLTSESTSLLSERGRVSVDARTNTLLINETREKLGEVRSLIERLDIPVRQVLIESRIVIANSDFTREIGTRFGTSVVATNGDNGLISSSGSLEATDVGVSDFTDDTPGFPIELGDLQDRFNVSLPVSGAAGSFALAILGSDYLVDLELSALQAEGRGNVISSPRVITANAKQASIEQGVEIPYQESTSSGATSISFKKAVLSLTVTPQITPDERVVMDLAVSSDTVGQQVANVLGGTIPSIDTREVVTQVLVENGETVVLGGIYEETDNELITKVPLLGDIPVLGALFRNKRNVSTKRELLIFITPKIVSESLAID
ncbi:type IV pilus secretin PilQ [uncultured Abyssibacter sp.]|uniref:type IV pilus secretin PilQ n=1 Tax=uncultured Abyssibacter sp. TaxID=2320202 RepID=UPI0032B2ED2C